jgi:hypothetical protein
MLTLLEALEASPVVGFACVGVVLLFSIHLLSFATTLLTSNTDILKKQLKL